ncbi:Type III restriction enzyme, res subunit family protein [Coccidioides posadasii C735 delta SOWgp]|uniref:Type III restriction enzyme, res subunit family protein n=1 Tax=Coccidioides posadasii (strain C735) TaxID=222929 RepID=C5PC10_COCP7|nr:Type III restriction enzyme, res subunit family protein [Coccidioides posadasii C735 delta SOWgp]EER25487.1 Type III restriction enzyme, res subunit family protein [Coccidioides posadasii C735 delta SOWgp]|eukprot:XP_003067632.1 Type III restriction enzyme, res subunit family protein [Coccidioides posadasii C735 delta SOWgp]
MSAHTTAEQSPKRRRIHLDNDSKMHFRSILEDGTSKSQEAPLPPRRARGYQLEMLSESLRQNIIVAMDTGSGKTEIAILRIQRELERCPAHKFVWFMAPTVALVEQQHSAISKQLPAFQTRLLTGAANVSHWSTKKIWDDILLNIRIVISTPQVLLDALSNGFVNLHTISLLVFDEAHHCVRDAPANRIMRDFYHYHRQEEGTDGLPHILGLTASPTTRARQTDLEVLEINLNAVCVTPKMHREEMMQFIHMPEYCSIEYQPDVQNFSSIVEKLSVIINELDIENDPFVKFMRRRNDLKSRQRLLDAFENKKTPCLDQLKRCLRRSRVIHRELGPWASERFLTRCIMGLKSKQINASGPQWADWDREDNSYMLNVLSQVVSSTEMGVQNPPDELSRKVHKLIDFLVLEHVNGSIGIVFAEERTIVIMLAQLLSLHPRTKHIKTTAFLGSSASVSRKSDITELHNPIDQSTAIDDLRTGKKDLIIATAVLEEGIDVPICDLVICFDLPKDLRSFIQRRGRARKKGSKFALFLHSEDRATSSELHLMEKTMKQLYLENKRTLEHIQYLENVEEEGYDGFRVASTGALLTLSNARNHLSHFCGTLSAEFIATDPEFVLEGDDTTGFSAKVILPSFLDPKLREFRGILLWKTEKMAKRDASFQAYVALYEAGLVNDYLMPAHHHIDDEDGLEQVEKRPSFAKASGSLNPWAAIAKKWREAKHFYQNLIEISAGAQALPPMVMVLPVELPCDISFRLFWNEHSTLLVSVKRGGQDFAADLIRPAADTTSILLSSLFSQKMVPGSRDFSWLFVPQMESIPSAIREWCDSVTGTISLHDIRDCDMAGFENPGLVRPMDNTARPCTFEKLVWRKCVPAETSDGASLSEQVTYDREVPHIEGTVWPKRTDFLHRLEPSNTSKAHHTAKCFYPANNCSVDRLPVEYSQFALFIPCLIHSIENYFIANELAQTILHPVGFSNLSLVLTAISSSAAREASNYQRLEFLGDSLLKLHTSIQLAADHPLWPEGRLTMRKGNVVSNGYLANAALQTGLDKFILTKPFTGAKWRPSYNTDHINTGDMTEPTREMSTKVLADVVEALIGAANIDGGENKILNCLKIFIPDIKWSPLNECVNILHHQQDSFSDENNNMLSEIEGLVGYTFKKKPLLLAAVTHPSSKGSGHSYQRLEFVGDSILDIIVVQELFESPRGFHHFDMHLMRTALVNADFLAFLCMNAYREEDRGEAVENSKRRVTVAMTKRRAYLWGFMKHSASWDIVNAQQRAAKQYEKLHEEIDEKLRSSKTYPWTLLCRLDAAKFFSDIVESILGAIFIDSQGSMPACRIFLECIGLIPYLKRVLSEDLDLMHPKERLGLLAGTLSVKYETKRTQGVEPQRWECAARVGDEEVVRVDCRVSRVDAETTAAEAAVAILKTRKLQAEASNKVAECDSDVLGKLMSVHVG